MRTSAPRCRRSRFSAVRPSSSKRIVVLPRASRGEVGPGVGEPEVAGLLRLVVPTLPRLGLALYTEGSNSIVRPAASSAACDSTRSNRSDAAGRGQRREGHPHQAARARSFGRPRAAWPRGHWDRIRTSRRNRSASTTHPSPPARRLGRCWACDSRHRRCRPSRCRTREFEYRSCHAVFGSRTVRRSPAMNPRRRRRSTN